MPQPLAAILFVGGDAPERAALVHALREAGFAVRTAADEGQTLEAMREGAELAVVAGGPELCRKIKAHPRPAPFPVLRLGGGPSPQEPWDADCDGRLAEPVDPHVLLSHVHALLRLGRSEAALQASEDRLRDILDHAPLVAYLKDLDGRYRFVNRRWETLFHFRRDAVVGKTAADVHPAAEAETLRANDRRVAEIGVPLEFEEVVSQDDGPHTYLSVKFALADAAGRPYAVGGVSTDITGRKRAEEALRDSEALYHSLVENLPVHLLRKDLHGRFTFANRALCAALKKPLAEVLGKTDFDFYPADLAGKYHQDDRRVVETGTVLQDVEEHQDPDGASTYVQVLKAPLYDARGQVIGVQGVYWDVTPHKRAEAEAGRAAAEFRVARHIQQKLFPRTAPSLPGLDIAVATFGFDIGGASYPAEAIGGDYYDFVALRDGGLGVAIGDVSGHGVGPAMLMAEVRAFFRAFAQTDADVGAILGLMNRVLLPDVDEDRFVTLLLARLDPHTRRFSYASAGHQPGFVLDAAGQVRRVLESTGTPLGIFADALFPIGADIDLGPGDLVLLVTDGVLDARAPDGTRFGLQRTLDLVRAYRRESAEAIVENLYHGVRAFGQTLPQYDDVTATVIKVAGLDQPEAQARD